jgi:hypothetical protein
MSISIGKVPRYEVSDVALTIYTNASNLLKLNTEYFRNDIQFRNFKLGQTNSFPNSFQLYQSNVLLSQYTSNEIIQFESSQYQSNVIVYKDITVQEQLQSQSLISSNIWIQSRTTSEHPLRIYDIDGTLFLDLDSYGNMNSMGNIGIGTFQPTAALEVVGNTYIHSNVYGGDLTSSNVLIHEIRALSNVQNSIQFLSSSIFLDANEVIVENPTLLGTITYDGTIALQQSIIDLLNSSNIRIINKSLNQYALSIQQLNPTFGDTSCNNPIHIDSYIASINETRPIFTVDAVGRISSGRFTSNIPNPDAGLSYQYDDARSVYLSGFMNFTTCNEYEQTIIDKKGHIGIGTSSVLNHSLQINQPYTANTRIPSLIGLYQSSNEPKSYLQFYTCNERICFNINSNGALLFQQDKLFDDRYRLEITSNAYINYLHTDNLFSSTGVIDFTKSYLCNMDQIVAHSIHVNEGGVLSNIFITGLSVDDINIGAFDYINNPSTGYNEFRISTTRLLYIGSNFVMNPNRYFFEVEQSNLTNDKIRIYANGDTTQEVNVIHTIANNSISTFLVTNCNTALNSAAQFEFEANQNKYQFGIINTSDFYGEAYITCNVDITDPNRELTITNDGIRIGTKTHILKTGKATLNNTTAGNHSLGLTGDFEVITASGASNFVITSEGNIGIGTNEPRTQMDIQTNAILFGNMGVGVLSPSYEVDISGTLRASRVLGVDYADLRGGAFNQWVLTNEGIYFTQLACNIGIGTTRPNASLHLHTSNITKNLFGSYHTNTYSLTWPPISTTLPVFTSNYTVTTSNITFSSNLRFPPAYLTSDSTNISASSVLYGSGTYIVTASTTQSGINNYSAFDNDLTTLWASDDSTSTRYNTDGTYTGTNSFQTIKGEWIQIDMPIRFVPYNYVIRGLAYQFAAGGNSSRASPRGWRLFGACNAAGPWTQLQVASNAIVSTSVYTFTSNVYTTAPYSSYAFVIEQVNIGTTADTSIVQIPNIYFNANSNLYNIFVGYTSNFNIITPNSTTIQTSQSSYHIGTYRVTVSPSNYIYQVSYTPYDISGIPLKLNQRVQSRLNIVSSPIDLINRDGTTVFTSTSNFTNTSDASPPLSIMIEYPSTNKVVKSYTIKGSPYLEQCPSKWNLYGSNIVYKNWVLLDQQDAITWTANEEKAFTLATPSSNIYYRYDFLRNNNATISPISIQYIVASNLSYIENMALLKYDPNRLTQSHTIVNGGMVVGYVSTSNQIFAPKDSLIVDGQIGIGTTYPTKSLHVQGDVRVTSHTSNEGGFYVGTNYDVYISTKLTSSNILVTSGSYETVLNSLNEGFSNIAYFPPTGLIRNTALTSNGSIIEWTSDSYTDGQGLLAGLSNIVIGSNGYYHSLILNMTGTVVDELDTYYTQITIPVGLSNLVQQMVEIHKLDIRSDGRFGGGSIFLGNLNNAINNTVIENRIYSYGTEQSELLLFKGASASDIFSSSIWTSVIWASELSLFVAVGWDPYIGTSTDGITWNPIPTISTEYWTSVCWSPELSLFVAVGWSSYVMTSPDGITWTNVAVEYNLWSSIAWSSSLSLFVAVSWGRIMTSSNGTTWTFADAPVSNIWKSICWSPELSLFVAVAYAGADNRVMTSSNGTSWTTQTTPTNTWTSVCWSPEVSLFVAVAASGTNDRVMTSPNGTTWTSRTSAVDNDWFSIVWSAELSLFMAVAYSYVNVANQVMTSTDGITWTASSTISDSKWHSICWSSELSRFVAVGGEGIAKTMYSTDGQLWIYATDETQTIRLRAGQIALDVYSSPTTDRNPENIQAYFTSNSFVASTVTTCNVQIHSISDTNGIYLLQRNIYDTPGAFTITPPMNLQYTYARIQMWGAGGGGGGANYEGIVNIGVGTTMPGGGGAGGGAYGEILMPYQILQNSTLIGNVGYGGAGGLGGYIATTTLINANKISSTAGVGRAATDGQNGTATTLSLSMTTGNGSLTATWYANGGTGGKVGITNTAGVAGTGGTTLGTFNTSQSGGDGGRGGDITSSYSGVSGTDLTAPGFAASGGGGGGGLAPLAPNPLINHSGGNSGSSCIPYAYLSGTTINGIADKANGDGTLRIMSQPAYTIADTYGGGTGGGGGYAFAANLSAGYGFASGNSGRGGGWPGGGGAGGGSAKQQYPNTGYSGYGASVTAGYGGNGGNGAIIITYY